MKDINEYVNIDRVLDDFFKLLDEDSERLGEILIAVKATLLFKSVDFANGELDRISLKIADDVVEASKETFSDLSNRLLNGGADHEN